MHPQPGARLGLPGEAPESTRPRGALAAKGRGKGSEGSLEGSWYRGRRSYYRVSRDIVTIWIYELITSSYKGLLLLLIFEPYIIGFL